MKKHKKKQSVSQAPGVLIIGRSDKPSVRLLINRQLEAYRQRYQRGDGAALLRALDLWLDCFRGPRAWIADEFFDAISRWLAGATLDEAFRVQRAPGEHVDQRRERKALRPRIMLEIARLVQQGAPLDARTFGRVGEEIGKSASYVSAVYYEPESAGWRKLLGHFHVRRQPISTK
jgi:hypothetical protein